MDDTLRRKLVNACDNLNRARQDGKASDIIFWTAERDKYLDELSDDMKTTA